jgi:hypothetical protein
MLSPKGDQAMKKFNPRLLLIAGLLLIFLQLNVPTFAGEKAPFRPDPARGSIGIEVKTLGIFSEPRSQVSLSRSLVHLAG